MSARIISPNSISCIQTQLSDFEPRAPISSYPANTNLAGLTWLKAQPPVLALEDSEYPAWLWTLLDEKKPGDGTVNNSRNISKFSLKFMDLAG
ncbi:hypothetical protein OPQ81_001559 [Rhizoctonia solani]|nr:hypothetical protein OPQ81_001559 [Rhizoctonia solani]